MYNNSNTHKYVKPYNKLAFMLGIPTSHDIHVYIINLIILFLLYATYKYCNDE